MLNDFMNGMFGEFADKFRKSVPASLAAPIPVLPGVIPTGRPAGSTPTARASEIRTLVGEFASSLNPYNQTVLQELEEAIAAYVENAIRNRE